MNNVIRFKRFTAPHPAAMAAAQLLWMNGLPLSEVADALKIWEEIEKDEKG